LPEGKNHLGPRVGGIAGVRADEGQQLRQRGVPVDVSEIESVEGAQLVVVFGHLARTERRPGGGHGGRPRVRTEERPVLFGDGCDPLPPPRGAAARHRGVDGVHHEVEQLVLAWCT
jgi:hypothetical protein